MKIQLIDARDDAEELVCRAARNDYRSEGVTDYPFDEVIEKVDPEPPTDFEGGVLEAKKWTLIKHLMRSGHWGPFEHVGATVALEGVSRVLMAQLTRHRHMTFDVMSMRYVGIEDEFGPGMIPYLRSELADRFRFPMFADDEADVDREGVHELEDRERIDDVYAAAYSASIDHYRSLLNLGVPQERARLVLPMGTKVNIVASANARAWMHVLNMRSMADVQRETREAALAIIDEMKEWMPYTFERFEEMRPMKLGP